MHHAASARARWLATARRPVLAGCSVALLVGGVAFAATSFSKSTRYPAGYSQNLTLSYRAQAAGNVYDGDVIRTGDPVLLRLADTLDVAIDYRLVAADAGTVRGTIGVTGRVSSDRGWQREVVLQEPRSFGGPQARARVGVDLTPMVQLARDVQRISGGSSAGYRIQLVPQVQANAALARAVQKLSFAPPVTFRLDGNALVLQTPVAAGQPVRIAADSPGPRGAVPMGPSWLSVEVGHVRALSLALLALGLFCLAGAALSPAGDPLQGDAERPARPARRRRSRAAADEHDDEQSGRDDEDEQGDDPYDDFADLRGEEHAELLAGPRRSDLARRRAPSPLVLVRDDEPLDEDDLQDDGPALDDLAEDDLPEGDGDQDDELEEFLEALEEREAHQDPADPDRVDLGPLDFSHDDLGATLPEPPAAAADEHEPAGDQDDDEQHGDRVGDQFEDLADDPADDLPDDRDQQPTGEPEEEPAGDPVQEPAAEQAPEPEDASTPPERAIPEPAQAPGPPAALLDRYFPERAAAGGRRRAAGPPDAAPEPEPGPEPGPQPEAAPQAQAPAERAEAAPEADVSAIPRQRAAAAEDDFAAALLQQQSELSSVPAPDRRPAAGRHRGEAGLPAPDAGPPPRPARQAHRHRSD